MAQAARSRTNRSQFSVRFKKQLDQVSTQIMKVEKNAQKQIQSVLKKTERMKSQQKKRLQVLIKDAKKMKAGQVISQAEKLKKEIESKANMGFEMLLKKLNMPSKKEVDALKRKVSSLDKKLKAFETKSQTR